MARWEARIARIEARLDELMITTYAEIVHQKKQDRDKHMSRYGKRGRREFETTLRAVRQWNAEALHRFGPDPDVDALMKWTREEYKGEF